MLEKVSESRFTSEVALLEKVEGKNAFEKAMLDFLIARSYLKEDRLFGHKAIAFDHIVRAIKSRKLPAEEFKEALLIEIELLKDFEWFYLAEQKAINYLKYIDKSFDYDVFTIFEEIATLRDEMGHYEQLLNIQTIEDAKAQNTAAQELVETIKSRLSKTTLDSNGFVREQTKINNIDNNSECKLFTLRCHEKRPERILKNEAARIIEKSRGLRRYGKTIPALDLLNDYQAETEFEIAMFNREKAYLHSKEVNFYLSAKYSNFAIKSQALNVKDHKYLMRLKASDLYSIGYFDESKKVINEYYQYTGQKSDNFMDALNLRIAVLQKNIALSRALQIEFYHSDERVEILKNYQTFKTLGRVSERKSKFVYTMDGNPNLIFRVSPKDPFENVFRNGSVTLQFDLNQDGNPKNIKVIMSYPKGYFDKVGIDALKQWRYIVSTDNNGKVIGGQNLTVQFDWKSN